ncbi:MAG: DUF2202 domain-containing protein [Pleomorphochaeta sp.]
MKKIIISLILVSSLSLISVFAEGTKEVEDSSIKALLEVGTNEDSTQEIYGAVAALDDNEFTLEEMLNYALQDERLALAEYEYIVQEFNVSRPFINIIKAEKTHQRAVLKLYDTYGFEISEFNAESHVVVPDSLEEIYNIGIEAEIANIAMYDKFLSYEIPRDVRQVFEALRKGSISHLKAFERQASKY